MPAPARRGRLCRSSSIAALLLAALPAAPLAAAEPVNASESAGKPGTLPVRVDATAEGGRRIAFRWWRHVDYEIVQEGRDWRIRFDRRAYVDAARLRADLASFNPRVVATPGGFAVVLTLPETQSLTLARDGNTILAEIGSSSATVSPPPAAPANETSEARPAASQPAAAEALQPVATLVPPASAADPGQVRHVAVPGGTGFRFEGLANAPAAVFRRGGGLWIAIEGSPALNLKELRKSASSAVPFIEQVPAKGATVLRLATLEGWNPTLRRADGAWIVELKRQPLRAETPVAVTPQPGALPPRILFALGRPSAPIRITDPEVGDELNIVLSPEPAHGLPNELSFVDVQSLPSAQGLAFRFTSDGVAIRSGPQGVEITRSPGLVLSSESDRQPRFTEPNKLFDFPSWAAPEGAFAERRQQLQQLVLASPSEDRTPARLGLVRFYLAADYGAEALGVLEAIQRDDAAAAAEPGFHALKGAAALLAGDRDTAARELRDKTLDAEPEIAPWRAKLAADTGDWGAALREFSRGKRFLPSYPSAIRHRFLLSAAEAALASGHRGDAAALLEGVLQEAPNPPERNAARLMQARLRQLDGADREALAILDEVAAGDDRPSRARAEYARTLLRHEAGEIDRGEAIRILERLRFAWRGDEFEFTVMRKLAELKLRDGDFRGGFDGLRQALTAFPDRPEARSVNQQLSDAFADLFLGPGGESVSPLKALALYDDYRDLLPPGERGNDIIRRLADRLVSVDLLDRAAALLDNQVKTRLTGREKARVATRLAVVRLLDRKPEAALEALAIDVGSEVSPELAKQRQQLRARALAELDRSEEALALLANDTSPDADRLRADIAWRTQNWREAATAFGRLAKPPAGGGGGALDDDNCRTVMNWVAALTLAGDRAGVAAVREKYQAAMEKSSYRDAFRVVAGEAGGGDLRRLAGQVAQIGDLQSFMTSYRQKIAGQNLSAIN